MTDPRLASYGSSNYIAAISQLAQTTLRSTSNTLILPTNTADIAGVVATAMMVLEKTRQPPAVVKG